MPKGGQYTSAPGKAIQAVGARRSALEPPDWLIVAAWPPELGPLRRWLRTLLPSLRSRVTAAPIGVGLVEAAIGAAGVLATLRPRAVILVGTAGAYPADKDGLEVGQAVVADDIALLSNVVPGRHVYLPDLVPSRVRPAPRLTAALGKAANLPAVAVATPLAITRSAEGAAFAGRHSRCAVENLEAFALARAATTLHIPFAVVLGIANRVGPSAHAEWRANAALATAAACQALVTFLTPRLR